jgi:hypothetical protein
MHDRKDAGFALILALLALLLLTLLGLGLATSTSTELQIANNYRNSQQALYNAEAGAELARRFLTQQVWSIVVPPARKDATAMAALPTWSLARQNPSGIDSRNFENSDCDATPATYGYQGVGYGVVLDHPGFAEPFQHVSTYLGNSINGTFTVWVRRPIKINLDGSIQDDDSELKLSMTVEGTAPYAEPSDAAQLETVFARRAVRIIEFDGPDGGLQKIEGGDCEADFLGQASLTALGTNYSPCNKLQENVGAIGGTDVGGLNK